MRATDVRVGRTHLDVALSDGRSIRVPIAWFPRLAAVRRIREEFENGRDYHALDRHPVRLPTPPHPPPNRDFLEWHGDAVFRG